MERKREREGEKWKGREKEINRETRDEERSEKGAVEREGQRRERKKTAC